MKRVSVEEAKPGMILARPIIDQQGRTIVNRGAGLTQLYISRLAKWGVTELHIETPEDQPAAAVAPVPSPASVPEEKPPAEPARPAPAAAPEEKPPPEPAASRLPPGVYRGPDLDARITETFSRVLDDPLMVVLCEVVRKRLAEDAAGGG